MSAERQQARCPHCSRILFLVNGKLPRHKVPAKKDYGMPPPLTGKDAKWCKGIG